MMARFFHVQLRTHDVEEARSFYQAVLGTRELDIVPLPAMAVARGARPHWLGYLGVDDVDAAVSAFVRRGAVALGPKGVSEGLEAVTVRDPSGAVLALARAHRAWTARTAAEIVCAGGGIVVSPVALPSGERLAVCDDSQGAAFAMREAAGR